MSVPQLSKDTFPMEESRRDEGVEAALGNTGKGDRDDEAK